MKKIYKSLLFAVIATLPFLTSCKDDNDSNPTLTFPESFVLNTPEFAANNVYDIPAANYVNLTTTQPDYGGWPAAVTYAVQISLDATNESGWKELATTYTSTKINKEATRKLIENTYLTLTFFLVFKYKLTLLINNIAAITRDI
jgi:hypothetical protein